MDVHSKFKCWCVHHATPIHTFDWKIVLWYFIVLNHFLSITQQGCFTRLCCFPIHVSINSILFNHLEKMCIAHQSNPCRRDHFVYAPKQWETTLHCNVVSHLAGRIHKIIPAVSVYTRTRTFVLVYCHSHDRYYSVHFMYFPRLAIRRKCMVRIKDMDNQLHPIKTMRHK